MVLVICLNINFDIILKMLWSHYVLLVLNKFWLSFVLPQLLYRSFSSFEWSRWTFSVRPNCSCIIVCVSWGKNVCFSENLTRFVFLKHPFWDSPFCLITDKKGIKQYVSSLWWDFLMSSDAVGIKSLSFKLRRVIKHFENFEKQNVLKMS